MLSIITHAVKLCGC